MRVLVTGSEGFIGSHLVEMLTTEGHDVVAGVQYNSFGRMGWIEEINLQKHVDVSLFDVRDYDMCKQLTSRVDAVIHLAALIGIPYSYKAISSYLETNVLGTKNICQASLDSGVEKVLVASTSEVYGSALFVPIAENHPLQAQSPYSASKIAADAIATSFSCSFGLPVTIFRPFNSYGPRQSRRAIISNVIAQCLSESDVIKVGNTAPTRDFTYVKDTSRGIVELLKHSASPGEVFNIGTGSEISISRLIDLIQEIIGTNKSVFQEKERVRPTNSEVLRLVCDSSKLERATGFRAITGLREGLEKTVEWFRLKKTNWYYKGTSFVE